MKTWFFFLFLTLMVGLIAGSVLGIDSGYVLLSYDKYSLETSLSLWLVFTVGLIVLVYVLFRASLLLLGNDWQFNRWRTQRRSLKARKQTVQGLLSLAQGQWRKAEKTLGQSAPYADTPLVNFLAAARAAAEQGKTEEALEWLRQGGESTRGASLAVDLMQAELLSGNGQSEQALAILLKLYKKHHKHAHILKLLVAIYVELEDWQALQKILPEASRYANLSEEYQFTLSAKVNTQLLIKAESAEQLKERFHSINRKQRYSLDIAKTYIELLLNKDQEVAEQELRAVLKNLWHDDLVRLYGTIKAEDVKRQLLYVEKQLNERPNDPVLFLTLGRLAVRAKQPEKAQDYFSAGLRLRNLPELHQEMALLRLAEGDEARACEHFQLAVN